MESSHSWSSAHAWKACIPQGIGGSNPPLSDYRIHGFNNKKAQRLAAGGIVAYCFDDNAY